MYRRFYGLDERPFDLTPDPRFLVPTQGHREALSHFEYAIASRKGMTLLIGEAGTGKTTVIRTALERQPARMHCVHVQNPVLTRPEFVELLGTTFGLTDAAKISKTALLLELESLLKQRLARGEWTVLVIDEAQSVPLELLEEIRLLANFDTTEGKLLSVVLAGQPELAARLNEQELRQLKQRVAMRCELHPLTVDESLAYVAGRIRAAGGIAAQLFTREAVLLMHERSRGIPRTISVIADNALVSGFAQEQRPVTAATVAEVCRDLDLLSSVPADGRHAAATTGSDAPAEPVPTSTTEAKRVLTFAGSSSAAAPAAPAAAVNESSDATTGPDPAAASRRRRFRFF